MGAPDRRTVIITGGSRGLGRALAERFGAAGDRVALSYLERTEEAEAAVAAIVRRGGEAFSRRADVRLAADAGGLMSAVRERWGSVDVLVNNAGITRDVLAVRMSEKDWDDVLDANLKGPFLCLRAAAGIMTRQRSGHVINIASLAGVRGREGQANYSASKAGLIGLTRAAAIELGPDNIKVNAVLPGYLATDMGAAARTGVRERAVRENALGRTSDPAEVAEFVYRLSLMKNVSGQVFNLDSRVP
jgi:3-oxoacyl-[acyl-carrier protein] reductase